MAKARKKAASRAQPPDPRRQDAADMLATFKAVAEQHHRSIQTWLARVAEGAQRVIDADVATPLEKRDARTALGYCRFVPVHITNGDTDGALYAAFQIGLAVQRINDRPLEAIVDREYERYFFWQGTLVKVSPTDRAILNFMQDQSEACLYEFVQACWGESYRAKHRSKYDKALSALNHKLADNQPPIRVVFRVRGDRITRSEAT